MRSLRVRVGRRSSTPISESSSPGAAWRFALAGEQLQARLGRRHPRRCHALSSGLLSREGQGRPGRPRGWCDPGCAVLADHRGAARQPRRARRLRHPRAARGRRRALEVHAPQKDSALRSDRAPGRRPAQLHHGSPRESDPHPPMSVRPTCPMCSARSASWRGCTGASGDRPGWPSATSTCPTLATSKMPWSTATPTPGACT